MWPGGLGSPVLSGGRQRPEALRNRYDPPGRRLWERYAGRSGYVNGGVWRPCRGEVVYMDKVARCEEGVGGFAPNGTRLARSSLTFVGAAYAITSLGLMCSSK